MNRFFVFLAVVVSGASILALEILGTRIIGPFYGVSLYLWSALIGVTLAALAAGYAIGGRWADRSPRLDRFALLPGLAGLWVVAVPWLRQPVLAVASSLGLRAAVLLTATVLFFPPLMLLGMVSPFAIRLRAARVEEVGRTAGNLYAVSTVASVVAALATGFYLIPHLGVGRLTLAIGCSLVLVSVLGLALARSGRTTRAVGVVLVLGAGAAFVALPPPRPDPERGLLAVEESAYAHLRVFEQDGLRSLIIDGVIHSAVDPVTLRSPLPYVDVLNLPAEFFARPGELLLVGLGGGSLASDYTARGWRVDAVEIDPAVTRLARAHFFLRTRDARVYHGDGRRYLLETDRAYDLVILDAFGSSSVPFHLVTREAFALARDRLKPGGILALNIWAIGWHDDIVHALAATLRTQFAHVLALPIAEPPDQLDNLILLASDRALELLVELPHPADRFSPEYNRAHAWDNRFDPEAARAPIVTDDRNPVDLWSERINLAARRLLHGS
ncbi:MAG TPA: fused MFS/spermidine synthase [Candidatus Krumholzibacteria bacterium]|nr:fused MFS/spermidine synthase [Candidatus Krumholzibacteria bacterium]HPD72007.1 fused MFS/spermidine synthase [Candidatus Krumholzibacteria bacterium]HRY41060.1 fused MFS/spermidine synthase [Candidatus Krumholzibacteria bacterium]